MQNPTAFRASPFRAYARATDRHSHPRGCRTDVEVGSIARASPRAMKPALVRCCSTIPAIAPASRYSRSTFRIDRAIVSYSSVGMSAPARLVDDGEAAVGAGEDRHQAP